MQVAAGFGLVGLVCADVGGGGRRALVVDLVVVIGDPGPVASTTNSWECDHSEMELRWLVVSTAGNDGGVGDVFKQQRRSKNLDVVLAKIVS